MTGTLKAKVNGVWTPIGGGASPTQQWNCAWGRIGYAYTNTQQAITTVVDLNGLSVPVTPPAGRMLLVTMSLVMQCDTAGKRMDAIIADGANNPLMLRSVTASTASGDETMVVQYYYETNGSSITFKGRAQNGSGGGTMYLTGGRFSFISVEDVGPVSGAIAIPDPTPAWLPLTLVNGWQQIVGSVPISYRKLGDMVQLRGAINRATALIPPTVSVCTTLPVGYRPPYSNINQFAVGVGTDGWGAPNYINILPNGDVGVMRIAEGATSPHILTGFEVQFSVTP